MRRAISWAYCAPKSTTRTVGKSTGSAPDDEVDALELLEVAVAGLRHRPAQRTEEVGPAVRRLRRTEQDLLQRPGGRHGGRRPAARTPRGGGGRRPGGSRGGAATESLHTPPAGTSRAIRSGSPSWTASAPQASARAMAPLDSIRPLAITCTSRPPVSSR